MNRPEMSGSSLRVLVVDDNADAVATMSTFLRMMGHDIRAAHDGLEAVSLASQFQPHAIVLDIGLPRLNGYDVARRIRGEPWGSDVVLIAVTGWGDEDDKQRAKEAGFDHHVVKPVEPQLLLGLLASLDRPA